MLAPQLVGRLLSEMDNNNNIRELLRQCDKEGPLQNALVPVMNQTMGYSILDTCLRKGRADGHRSSNFLNNKHKCVFNKLRHFLMANFSRTYVEE